MIAVVIGNIHFGSGAAVPASKRILKRVRCRQLRVTQGEHHWGNGEAVREGGQVREHQGRMKIPGLDIP